MKMHEHLLHLHLCLTVMFITVSSSDSAKLSVLIHFDEVPPTHSRFTDAFFRYSFLRPNSSDACKPGGCSIHCELDGQPLRHCPPDNIQFNNLTVNQKHSFLLKVSTWEGRRNSSVYTWFIDTKPPSATISSKRNYTNADSIEIEVTFTEACSGPAGFNCYNSSNCDVIVSGPASVDTSSPIRVIKPNIQYALNIIFSERSTYARVVITMAERFCTDQAGNYFTRTNESSFIVHLDRRPVQVDLWISVPSYELEVNGHPRTVIATNKSEDLHVFLDFSSPVMNSTLQIMHALQVNSGNFVPSRNNNNGNHRFAYEIKNISTGIVEVGFKPDSVIGLSDSESPRVELSTSSSQMTTDSSIDVIVKFTEPVFGFEASKVELEGGNLTRFEEHSRVLYSLTIIFMSQSITVTVPKGKAYDISGNQNSASNVLKIQQYSTPTSAVVIHTFMTSGILATAAASAVISLSSTNLVAISRLDHEVPSFSFNHRLMNLQGMVGHLQVFVLANWISINLPLVYVETTRGLRWIIPHKKLPWVKERSRTVLTHLSVITNVQSMSKHQSSNAKDIPYGLPLGFNEYFTYFLHVDPFLTMLMIKKMEKQNGWEDLKMNLFWLGVAVGSLVLIQAFWLFFLQLRSKTSVRRILSVPRFWIFLLIVMLPCISQSSAFVITGGTSEGILAGALLLAIPMGFILSVFLFHTIVIFPGNLTQYKEVKYSYEDEQWYKKFCFLLVGRQKTGKWFYRKGVTSYILQQFDILFENQKGPPLFVLLERDDSIRSGIGRIRTENSDYSNEEIKATISERLLGCARSSYIILDLIRRTGLGIVSGIHSKQGLNKSIIALALTVVQFSYLIILKPYISRGVHMAESISLMCEIGLFSLAMKQSGSSIAGENIVGWILLGLLILTYIANITSQWFDLIKCILQFSLPQKKSFRLGLKNISKGLVLPFIPRKYWIKEEGIPESERTLPSSSKTATVVPVISPNFSPNPMSREVMSSMPIRTKEKDHLRELKIENKNEMKKLRQMAKASFTGGSKYEMGSTSYDLLTE
ncbi:uncharacterized protein LOC124918052 isoform X2 [Impatiens glandulifera]|uniref:uncharacterized protein LOC124918052 isoform X2 n=1 Tax=Impatiens glandulifera TaxID=253017 RepID=UPI001FB0FA2C|nr:uncharacterized protein LOC124918052 isoform X2 [Impatiens glandulifera]